MCKNRQFVLMVHKYPTAIFVIRLSIFLAGVDDFCPRWAGVDIILAFNS